MLADSTMVSSGRPVHLASEFLSLWIYIFLNGNSNDAGIKLGKKKRKDSNENPHLVQMVQSSFGAILPPSLWLSEKSILTNNSVSCSFIFLFVYFFYLCLALCLILTCVWEEELCQGRWKRLFHGRGTKEISPDDHRMINENWQGFTVMYNF